MIKPNQDYPRGFAASLKATRDPNFLRVVRDNEKFLADLAKPENRDILDIVMGRLPRP